MLEKMEIGEHVQEEQYEIKEKIENTLCKLQELKGRIAELKHKVEELRKMEFERTECAAESMPHCDKCGHALDSENQVVVRDSNGEERRHYHMGCFKTLFK